MIKRKKHKMEDQIDLCRPCYDKLTAKEHFEKLVGYHFHIIEKECIYCTAKDVLNLMRFQP